MNTTQADVFISYGRQGSAELARLAKEGLEKQGLEAFIDVEDLRAGRFDTALWERIEDAPDLVVILTPNSLDPRQAEEDWLAHEVAHALGTGRNVVPLATGDFASPDRAVITYDLARLQFRGDRWEWGTETH